MGKIRTCEKCLWKDSCENIGTICKKHTTIFERRDKLDFSLEDWDKFEEEWDKARERIRKYAK